MFDEMFDFEVRQSDSPLVEQVWWATNERAGRFVSTAQHYLEAVVSTRDGQSTLTFRGATTTATTYDCEANGEWIGIRFKPGVFTPHLPISQLVDDVWQLPEAEGPRFWLRGRTWTLPTFENADTFVDWLVRDGLLVREPLVDAALDGCSIDTSVRSVQRRFARATGITVSTYRQIERARQAMELLRRGESILDVVYEVGYYDQPHLTRSLKRWLGQTPAQIAGLSVSLTT